MLLSEHDPFVLVLVTWHLGRVSTPRSHARHSTNPCFPPWLMELTKFNMDRPGTIGLGQVVLSAAFKIHRSFTMLK